MQRALLCHGLLTLLHDRSKLFSPGISTTSEHSLQSDLSEVRRKKQQ